MKKIISTALILFALAQIPLTVAAQCNPAIPNTANVVSFSQTVNGGFTPQWVCSGDTLFSGGGIFFVYLEPGAVMETGGGIDTIYMKSGSVLNMNGGIHVIYFEPGAILNIAGGIPTYDSCASVTFDYNNAPSAGCFPTSSSEIYTTDGIFISPNPATTEIKIENGKGNISSVEIFNTLGEKVYNNAEGFRSNAKTINVSILTPGIYFVRVKTSVGMSAGKFVKE
jgi:hypothetical protein